MPRDHPFLVLRFLRFLRCLRCLLFPSAVAGDSILNRVRRRPTPRGREGAGRFFSNLNRSKRRKQRKKAESHCAAGPLFPRTSLPFVPLCRRRRFDPQSRSAPPNSSRAGKSRTFLGAAARRRRLPHAVGKSSPAAAAGPLPVLPNPSSQNHSRR